MSTHLQKMVTQLVEQTPAGRVSRPKVLGRGLILRCDKRTKYKKNEFEPGLLVYRAGRIPPSPTEYSIIEGCLLQAIEEATGRRHQIKLMPERTAVLKDGPISGRRLCWHDTGEPIGRRHPLL